MPPRIRFLLSLTALAATFPASLPADEPSANAQRVQAFVAAYNNRDLDAMLALATDDIQWLSVAGDKIAVETNGKARLRESMTKFFKSPASTKSELEWIEASASRVAALERASWQSKSGPRSQKSLSIYEFKDNLINRVYYYPTEK
jgi:hypothetical protein